MVPEFWKFPITPGSDPNFPSHHTQGHSRDLTITDHPSSSPSPSAGFPHHDLRNLHLQPKRRSPHLPPLQTRPQTFHRRRLPNPRPFLNRHPFSHHNTRLNDLFPCQERKHLYRCSDKSECQCSFGI